jgi:5-methylcytosine-specific restriction endonuclease McrA
VCEHNPDPASSPEQLCLPADDGQIEAARETLSDNKGAQWTLAQAIGLLVGENAELKYELARFLWEVDGVVPTATIEVMTGYDGREQREIATSDPIAWFRCLYCEAPLLPRARRAFMSMSREHRAICAARSGDLVIADSLCQRCFTLRLEHYADAKRVESLAQQARRAQRRKMRFEEYRLTPEWQTKRTQALSRAGHRCQTCGCRCGDVRLDVHHNTYERYGDESIFDLIVLCARCHARLHDPMEDAS